MKNSASIEAYQPKIVKYSQNQRVGIQSMSLTRHSVGFVVKGTKYVYYGDIRQTISAGDIFFFSSGNHYTEDVPDGGKPFEQIVFYYTPQLLSSILSHLSINYRMKIGYTHNTFQIEKHKYPHASCHAWGTMRNFFMTANQYIKDNLFSDDDTAENIKMTELIYLIVSQHECCIKTKIMESVDENKDNFEQIIFKNIFNDISVEDLAERTGRSMTSFKKEFRKIFCEPPHKWFIQQRLLHSRLLLISTSRSVAEIGDECTFPNTSHYIKLFKKEFGLTPAAYRTRYLNGDIREHDSRKQIMNMAM